MRFDQLKRRDFISLLGGAAGWPIAAQAQQPAMPVIGYLASTAPYQLGSRLDLAFREGLRETGFVEGQNVVIEYRSAQARYERLPEMAADLVRRKVAVIFATGAVQSPLAAKAATATIPIVFALGSDPVEIGLVTSLGRPGGNVTGATSLSRELLTKRLEVLRELLPNVGAFGLLVNPRNSNAELDVREAQAMAQSDGWRLNVVEARDVGDIENGIARLAQLRVGGFFHGTDAFINSRGEQIVALAARYAIPAIFAVRETVEIGGLMSYGGDGAETSRIAGRYVGRILKGEKPADLPVQRASKVELVINLKTAKTLGLKVPLSLLGRADEVIE
jgi:putative ABC transport system substrate-binding protein